MKRIGTLLMAIAASVGFLAPAWADGAEIVVREGALPIEARSARAALSALQADENLRAHALTRSRLTLRLELMPELRPIASDARGDGEGCTSVGPSERAAPACRLSACRLSDFEVRMEIDVLIPEWHPTRAASTEELAVWQEVQSRLRNHEQRHREHAEAAARRLDARLSERLHRVEEIDCLRLRTALENLREIEVQDLRLRDRVFDEAQARAMRLGKQRR